MKRMNLRKQLLIAVTSCAAFRGFNLSWHKSLRTLETTAQSISHSWYYSTFGFAPNPSDFFRAVLSSITSPGPLNVVVIYQDIHPDHDRLCGRGDSCNRHLWLPERIIMNEECFQQQLTVFREMRIAQDFHLVLSVDPFGCMMDQVTRLMERIVNAEKAAGGFGFLSCEPLMVYERRLPRTRTVDYTGSKCGEMAFREEVNVCCGW